MRNDYPLSPGLVVVVAVLAWLVGLVFPFSLRQPVPEAPPVAPPVELGPMAR